MVHKTLLSQIFIVGILLFAVLLVLGETFSRVIHDGDRTFIVDRHGERWDVTQARSIGFMPDLFRHGIGRNAFTPLDDSNLRDDRRNVSKNTRVIGVSDGKQANAYSVPRLRRHEVANSRIGEKPIAAAY